MVGVQAEGAYSRLDRINALYNRIRVSWFLKSLHYLNIKPSNLKVLLVCFS